MGIFDFLTQPKPGNMTQTQQTILSPEKQAFFDSIFGKINSSQMPTAFAGPGVAGTDPATTAGQNQVIGAAGGAGQTLANAGTAAQLFNLDPARLNVTSDPNITRQAAAATAAGTMNAQDMLRNVRGESISGDGLYGSGSRGALREGAAYGNVATGNEKIVADLFANAYQGAANRQQHAVDANGNVINTAAAPGVMMDAVGQQRQAQAQKELDDQISRYYQPYLMQQSQIMQMLQQMGLMPGDKTVGHSTGTQPQGPLLTQVLGAAAAGASKMPMPG